MKRLRYIGIWLLWSIGLCAQTGVGEGRALFLKAQTDYQIGRVDSAIVTLQDNLPHYEGEIRASVYRLLALCYLAQDDMKRVNHYVSLLLQEDPYYTIQLDDPVRFADLIREKKVHTATLVTASQQAETLEEAPVPVTLITEEMIKMLGMTTLQDVLKTFVPGIMPLEGENVNISMRGVYTSSQQNVLILLNGHRLNSHLSNSISPDYRISLENIKQIEVLRGAASSLYGNVALSAVVNLITKSGKEINGIQASYSMGNGSTYKGNVLFGKSGYNTDLLLWASLYHSKGYKFDIPWGDEDSYGVIPRDGSIYVNGYNRKPTYDLGLNYVWNHFKLTLNHRHGKRVSPYTSSAFSTFTTYDYEKYERVNGNKPGRSTSSTFGVLQYANTVKNTSFDLSFSVDYEHISNYLVEGDTVKYPLSSPSDESVVTDKVGVFQFYNWRSLALGGEARMLQRYAWGSMSGNLLLGIQYSYFTLFDNSFGIGDRFGRIVMMLSNEQNSYEFENQKFYVVENGSEDVISAFVQVKHYFHPKLIFNGGLRYDRKVRSDWERMDELSPRVSLIYLPRKEWNMKLSFARSFVDAPYMYRSLPLLYPSDEGLGAQHLNSVQFSSSVQFLPHLEYDVNFYYNKVDDLVQQGSTYLNNAGSLETIGWENSVHFHVPNLSVYGNLSLQHLLSQEQYTADDKYVYSVPNFMMNWVVDRSLAPWLSDLWATAKLAVYGKQEGRYGLFAMKGDQVLVEETIRQPAYALLDLGLRYSWNWMDFQVRCSNLLDHTYRLGGRQAPVLQPGRTFLGTVTFHIR
ncbi:MAG: TonB-dependent receptor plug domain-containing protein [Parabacteroides sp.]